MFLSPKREIKALSTAFFIAKLKLEIQIFSCRNYSYEMLQVLENSYSGIVSQNNLSPESTTKKNNKSFHVPKHDEV